MGKTWQLSRGSMVDHYRVMRPVGRGGMGEVYLARDTKLGRRVALKVVNQALLPTPAAVSQFLVEAQATARFNHPNIVTIYATGEHQGAPYVALEYLEGQTLRARMREERPGLMESLRICLAIAAAAGEAHRHEILHLDLKPSNVIIPGDGRLRVLDFGLARVMTARSSESGLIALGSSRSSSGSEETSGEVKAVGTPRYMAPEQWLDGETSGATDVWALGVMLYELVHGRHPFEAGSRRKMAQRIIEDTPDATVGGDRELPPELPGLIRACLRKDPRQRPSAPGIVDALGRVIGGTDRPARAGNPFRGLLAFEEQHAGDFFGRDAEVAALVERLRQEPVVPVVGPSGSGKSSLVQAGVIPRLKEQGAWRILRLRPGRDPFGALARLLEEAIPWGLGGGEETTVSLGSGVPEQLDAEREALTALARRIATSELALSMILRRLAEQTKSKVLLFVDQLEELYTTVDDEEARRRFMTAICSGSDDREDPVRVIFTLRDDFIGRLAGGVGVQEALGRVFVVGSPEPDALREILVQPLRRAGYSFDEPELVDEMVDGVRGEPACLPLLQFAARVLWDQRDEARRRLLSAAYRSMGGVAGALARHADGVLDGMSPAEVRTSRHLLLRLITADGTRDTQPRQRVLEGMDASAPTVLQRLIEARLVSVRKASGDRPEEEAELELAHESLIYTWSRLARWIEEGREDLAFLREVEQAADLWERRGRRSDEVWTGEALAEAVRARKRCSAPVPGRVSRFLAAGLEREQRRVRRRRLALASGVAFLGLVALAAVAAALVVADQRDQVRIEKRRAETQSQLARARAASANQEGAAAALARGDLLEARARLRLSLEIQDSLLARVLWWRLEQNPLRWRRRLGAMIFSVAYAPDGKTVAAASQNHAVYLIDVATRSTRLLRGNADQVLSTAFSPDGSKLATGTLPGQVGLWDLRRRKLQLLGRHGSSVWGVAFSPDGRLLASASKDKTVRLWSVATGALVRTLAGYGKSVLGVTFSPDSRTVATGSADKTVRLWSVASGAARVLRGHPSSVWGVSFSPDGRLLASGSTDGSIRLWEVATGRTVRVLRGHTAEAWAVRFGPGGRRLISGGLDKTVRVWDAASGRQLKVFRGHTAAIWSVSVSPDGRRVASGSLDKSVRLWDVEAEAPAERPRPHTTAVTALDVSRDGKLIASGGADKVQLWSAGTGEPLKTLEKVPGQIWAASFDPAGRRLAFAGTDEALRIWNHAQDRVTLLRGHTSEIKSVRFSADGKLLVSGGRDSTVRLWDATSATQLRVLRGHASSVMSVAISPDDARIASGDSSSSIRLWETKSGRMLRKLEGHAEDVSGLAFSPDGRLLASAGDDGTVRLWQVKTGQGRLLGRHGDRVYAVAFHPDGQRLATTSSDGTARLWSLKDGASAVQMRGHRGEANALAFGRGGQVIATAGDDGTVRLWETDTGRPVWRAPLLLESPPEVFSHQGWRRLDRAATSGAADARWRRTVAARTRRGAPCGDRRLCLLTHDGRLELWDRDVDRLVHGRAVAAPEDVLAVPAGCVVRTRKGQVSLIAPGGRQTPLATGVEAMAQADGEILLAAGAEVAVHGPDGVRRRTHAVERGVTALAATKRWILTGYADGNMELVSRRAGEAPPRFTFEGVPSSPVVRMLVGPRRTLVAGHANGFVGIWSLENGALLHHDRLHGPASQLRLGGRRLLAASELGATLAWDLETLFVGYCELLARVWREVPVVWERGLPALAPLPAGHRCRRRGPGGEGPR